MSDNIKKIYKLNLIQQTKEDYNKYNIEYLKPCKLYYIIDNKTFKCNHCLEFYPHKFTKNK